MKWIFGLLVISLFWTSCDNELVVTDEWEDIPVVWGLLNKSDTAHYIRVEKAFLDPTTSAFDIARIPDSLYYENASVSLTRVNTGQVFPLERVDGSSEGYPREGGIFAETPNYLYKIKANVINLVPGESYEFTLDKGDGTALVKAQTIIIPKPVLRTPSPGSLLVFKRNAMTHFNWNPIPQAFIFDLHLKFHYRERSPETGNIFVPKSVEWTVVKNWRDNDVNMEGTEFYNALKSNIEADIAATRLFDSIDVILWAGGKEMWEFIKITNANQGSITGTQDFPKYTNLSEGYGIFDSRNVTYQTGFSLNTQTLDSLRNSVITNDLNFQ